MSATVLIGRRDLLTTLPFLISDWRVYDLLVGIMILDSYFFIKSMKNGNKLLYYCYYYIKHVTIDRKLCLIVYAVRLFCLADSQTLVSNLALLFDLSSYLRQLYTNQKMQWITPV